MKKQETLRALDQMTITHEVHMDMMRRLEGEKIRFYKKIILTWEQVLNIWRTRQEQIWI